MHSAAPLAIFAVTYVAMAVGKLPLLRIDRAGAAMVGAIAMVVVGALSEPAALAAIDFRTLGLLLGMMILVADLRLSGIFGFVGDRIFHRARTGFELLALTIAVSGVLAAFFVNDVVCLILVPVLMDIAAQTGIAPAPLLIGLASASNIGSSATLTGNPQNMIVAGFARLGYWSFLIHIGPAALAGLVLDFLVIATVYRCALGKRCLAAERGYAHPVRSWLLAVKSIVVAGAALICFALGFPTDLVALSGASIVLVIGHNPLQRIYEQVDFTMLLMFAGLFVVVGGIQATGFDRYLLGLIGAARLEQPVILAACAAVLSNLVSNVPAVMLFRPVFGLLHGGQRLGLLLAAASTYAGNLTLLGSVANLIVIEQARARRLDISFTEHLAVGVPITLLTLAIAVLVLG